MPPHATLETPRQLPSGRRRGRWLGRALLFAACALLMDAFLGDRGLVGLVRARTEYCELTAGLARLTMENAGLREQARRLQQDPAMIEQIARQDLGLIRPGEILVVVKDLK